METAFARAASLSTLLVNLVCNSSPNKVSLAFEKLSEPNLPNVRSIAPRTLVRLDCEMYSDAFPSRHKAHCMSSSTSVAGTNKSGFVSIPASRRFFQPEARGRAIARTEASIAKWLQSLVP